MHNEIPSSDEVWRKVLSSEEYRVLRERGTEPPFTGEYVNNHESGTYDCAGCGNHLFSSTAKFESGSGWPSFFQALDSERVNLLRDENHGMVRTEVVCGRCGSHLGHLFDDGPEPTGQRYCMNSLALQFQPE